MRASGIGGAWEYEWEENMTESLRFLKDATWHSEPPSWDLKNEVLEIVTGNETDFWQDTFYGFRRDDGHFLGAEAEGDFTATVTFEGAYEVLYDQAGMMMRADAQNWLKTGIEFSDEVTNFSVVITRDGRSDWSVIGVPRVSGPQKVRLTRLGDAVLAHFQTTDGGWQLMRVGNLHVPSKVLIGPMTCSPQRGGFKARFQGFEVRPAISNPLHGE